MLPAVVWLAILTMSHTKSTVAETTVQQREAHECSPRGGMPQFLAKLRSSQPVTIAYLGGSITAQEGWRVFSQQWLAEHYANKAITEINAAIGGTGSELGVFRLHPDVLRHRPDLLFIEFAVNDAGQPPASIIRSMEGIIRQTWEALPHCDICLVYTIKAVDIDPLNRGMMTPSASAMEVVADHYQLPSIHMGVEVARLVREGRVIMKESDRPMDRVSGDELNQSAATRDSEVMAFSSDGVHPYLDTGHRLYMDAIARSFPIIQNAAAEQPRHIPEPIDLSNLQHAKMLPISEAMLEGSAVSVDLSEGAFASFAKRLDQLWRLPPGATLSFSFRGSKVMIYDLKGPGAGLVEVEVDGQIQEQLRFDSYCTYYRLSSLPVADNLNPDVLHHAKITVKKSPIEKAKILQTRHPGVVEKNPEDYQAQDWYISALMIVGDVVTQP